MVLLLISLLAPALAGSFEDDLDARVEALRASSPEDAALVDQVQLTPTRAGFLRLVGEGLETDVATPLLAQRLLRAEDSAETRQALARTLAGNCSDHFDLVAGVYAQEQDLEVRGILLGGMSRADERAVPILGQALLDESPRIRLEAARVLGHHPSGADLLLAVLDDSDEDVRAMAVRKLGYLEHAPAFEALEALLGDESALVRLQAINALERLDTQRAAALMSPLVQDSDLAVRRAAERVAR
jgi:HEAT repeat protein